MATYNKINSKMIEATLGYGEQIYSRRGAMLAYTGQVNFHPTSTAGASMGGFVGRMVAGEQVPLMVSEGQGTVLYGHGGMQTKIVQVTGEQLTIEADKLLCYDGGLQAGTMFLGQNGGLRLDRAGPDDRPRAVHDPAERPRHRGHALARAGVRARRSAATSSRSIRRPTSATRA